MLQPLSFQRIFWVAKTTEIKYLKVVKTKMSNKICYYYVNRK